MGEREYRKLEVVGSNPTTSTISQTCAVGVSTPPDVSLRLAPPWVTRGSPALSMFPYVSRGIYLLLVLVSYLCPARLGQAAEVDFLDGPGRVDQGDARLLSMLRCIPHQARPAQA